MPEPAFWALIEESRRLSNGLRGRQEAALTQILRALSPEEVNAFYNRFTSFKHSAYTWPLWAAAYVMRGGCSDDSFSDFRGWLIGEGQEVFKAAMADADSLVSLSYDAEEDEWEGLGYVPVTVQREKCGDNVYFHQSHPKKPSGEDWEDDDLPSVVPKLCAKYEW